MAKINATAGKRDQRVEIQQLDTNAIRDEAGEIDETADLSWATYCYRWCSVSPLAGQEADEAKQTQARSRFEVRMNSDTETRAINTKMRLIHRGRKLNIEFADDLESANREVYLICTGAS